jgi:hypothetical protein
MEIGLFQCVIILGILIIYFITKKYIPFKLIYSLLVLTSVFVVLWQTRFNSFVFTNFDFDIYEGGLNMGVAALVLGIVSLVIGLIPFCGTWALIPAIVGLILGIIDSIKKKKAGEPRGKAIAGTICSILAIVVIIFYYVVVISATSDLFKSVMNTTENMDYQYEVENFDYLY